MLPKATWEVIGQRQNLRGVTGRLGGTVEV